MKTSFLTIVSVLSAIAASTSAFATNENTVTSKSYVDAQDALKQDKIPAAGTNEETPGESVVTYTDTAGTIGERYIYDGTFPYTDRHADELITAGAVQNEINGVNQSISTVNQNINNINTNTVNNITNMANTLTGQALDRIDVPSLECANQECTLYRLNTFAGIAHKLKACTTVSDCGCGDGFKPFCKRGFCECVYGACSTASDCTCDSGMVASCVSNVCQCGACKVEGVACSSDTDCCGPISQGYGCTENNVCGTRQVK